VVLVFGYRLALLPGVPRSGARAIDDRWAPPGVVTVQEMNPAAAAGLRKSVRTVQSYLDPAQLAESVAATFGEELPGHNVLGLPHDVLSEPWSAVA
jgi:hypothetical protein